MRSLMINTNVETIYQLPSDFKKDTIIQGQEITLRELEVLLETLSPYFALAQKANLSQRFQEHIGNNSTYLMKSEVKKGLKIINNHLKLTSTSESEKALIAIKLYERALNCTPGFHDGVNSIIESFYAAKNINDLLFRFRQDIVSRMANRLTDEVHANNRCFTVATASGYGIRPLNSHDIYGGELSDNFIIEELQRTFQTEMTLYKVLNGLTELLRGQLSFAGYDGRKDKGYDSETIDKISQEMSTIFSQNPIVEAYLQQDAIKKRLSEQQSEILEQMKEFMSLEPLAFPELHTHSKAKLNALLDFPSLQIFKTWVQKGLDNSSEATKEKLMRLKRKYLNLGQEIHKQLQKNLKNFQELFYIVEDVGEDLVFKDIHWQNVIKLIWQEMKHHQYFIMSNEIEQTIERVLFNENQQIPLEEAINQLLPTLKDARDFNYLFTLAKSTNLEQQFIIQEIIQKPEIHRQQYFQRLVEIFKDMDKAEFIRLLYTHKRFPLLEFLIFLTSKNWPFFNELIHHINVEQQSILIVQILNLELNEENYSLLEILWQNFDKAQFIQLTFTHDNYPHLDFLEFLNHLLSKNQRFFNEFIHHLNQEQQLNLIAKIISIEPSKEDCALLKKLLKKFDNAHFIEFIYTHDDFPLLEFLKYIQTNMPSDIPRWMKLLNEKHKLNLIREIIQIESTANTITNDYQQYFLLHLIILKSLSEEKSKKTDDEALDLKPYLSTPKINNVLFFQWISDKDTFNEACENPHPLIRAELTHYFTSQSFDLFQLSNSLPLKKLNLDLALFRILSEQTNIDNDLSDGSKLNIFLFLNNEETVRCFLEKDFEQRIVFLLENIDHPHHNVRNLLFNMIDELEQSISNSKLDEKMKEKLKNIIYKACLNECHSNDKLSILLNSKMGQNITLADLNKIAGMPNQKGKNKIIRDYMLQRIQNSNQLKNIGDFIGFQFRKKNQYNKDILKALINKKIQLQGNLGSFINLHSVLQEADTILPLHVSVNKNSFLRLFESTNKNDSITKFFRDIYNISIRVPVNISELQFRTKTFIREMKIPLSALQHVYNVAMCIIGLSMIIPLMVKYGGWQYFYSSDTQESRIAKEIHRHFSKNDRT